MQCDMNIIKNNMSFDRLLNIFLPLITHGRVLLRLEAGVFIFVRVCLHMKALLTDFLEKKKSSILIQQLAFGVCTAIQYKL